MPFQKGQKGYWTGKKRYYENPQERNNEINKEIESCYYKIKQTMLK